MEAGGREVDGAAADRGTSQRGLLALTLEEVLTVVARVRADRQVAEDGAAFRSHVKRLLGRADHEARGLGYADESVRLALYAVVAFLDESVLNSPRPMFQDWHGQPLQDEVFGDHRGGETFYHYLDDLLKRSDSHELADLLEVFQLCLLLGFRGRYGDGAEGERTRRVRAIQEKVHRTRGGLGPMAPSAALPVGEKPPAHRDPWVRRMGIAALGGLVAAILALALFRLGLRPGLADVRELTSGIVG